jgi:hypothetical protein
VTADRELEDRIQGVANVSMLHRRRVDSRDELIVSGRKEHRQHIVDWRQPEATIVTHASLDDLNSASPSHRYATNGPFLATL